MLAGYLNAQCEITNEKYAIKLCKQNCIKCYKFGVYHLFATSVCNKGNATEKSHTIVLLLD